jgi:putative CocE/NonD family hydrolase
VTEARAYDQPFRLMLNRKIPMRDGVDLSADIYLPNPASDAVERYPALLLRTIYHSKDPRYVKWAVGFVRRGYAVVLQDCRGRHDSDGTWEPYTCEIPDGFDTHEWIGAQPWCDGQIGTFGVSYPGFTQTCPAPDGSKHLKALVPIASQQDNFGHHRCDGLIAWANTVFFANMAGRTMQGEAIAQLDQAAIARHLPLHSTWDETAKLAYFDGVVANEAYGAFWSSYSLRHRYDAVETPAYFMTGWYDSLLNETLRVFRGWRTKARSADARRFTKILIGPWSHQVAPWGRPLPGFDVGPDGAFDAAVFGPGAVMNIVDEHARWYDSRLRGIANGMDGEPPIRLFVMGENVWRHESEWPLARTRWTDLYLRADGGLSFEAPHADEAPEQFRYDPADPAPTWGGSHQMKDFGGPKDRRKIADRPDMLVFTTPVLDHDVEVTGPVTARLWAASSCLDTDFTIALSDVFPDGRVVALTDGICRARFRKAAEGWKPEDQQDGRSPYETLYEGTFETELMVPGTAYEFAVDLWSTSNLFKRGHRIRVEISSSNFPRYDRNLNTGGRVGFESAGRVAEQTVFHDSARPSRLILPMIPR